LIRFSMSCSLDGFVEDAEGNFDFGFPSEEVHAFINDRLRSVETYVFGRRMYETMRVWDTMDDPEPVMQDFAQIWRGSDKVVFSHTLDEADITTERTRLEREFDPEFIRAIGGEIEIGGPTLAAPAFEAGLFDQIELYVYPAVLGSGKPVFPPGLRLDLRLVSTRSFDNGAVYVEYAR
jgi:dihydrofolate reductase